ncbi:hypothetical protein AJ79_05451 [Helicocarpus griseus UAMH5409]|uniref:Uncharacterized protein n=1 Tax=Helicocarpus griseus UAMH5409 TaxID=1447875 RepID=A0A2B7XNZ6_9EURO|nr:hypothetical protein AJ79_05451 [Helicocarpus griseus UAMH5409]
MADGKTALQLAATAGHESVAQLLLDNSAEAAGRHDDCNDTPLMYAVAAGQEGMTRLLLNQVGFNITNTDRWTPLTCAIRNGHSAIVEALLQSDSFSDLDIHVGLSMACQSGQKEIVKLLLAPDVWVSIDGEVRDEYYKEFPPLAHAINQKHVEILEVLLAHEGTDVNVTCMFESLPDCPALCLAAAVGFEAGVEMLLAHPGIEINSENKHGVTALGIAAERGHARIVEILLACDGIDHNHVSRAGQTPLSIAAYIGQESAARVLLNDPRVIIWGRHWLSGETAFMLAAKQGHEKIVRLFLARSEDNREYGKLLAREALEAAQAKGHWNIVALLLESSVEGRVDRWPDPWDFEGFQGSSSGGIGYYIQ